MPVKLDDMYCDLSFIPSPNNGGDISMVYGKEAINQSLSNIMNTLKGSRIMEPTFGCNFKEYIFDIFDEQTAKKIVEDLRFNFSKFEPRVSILKIDTKLNQDRYEYELEVFYQINETGEIAEFKATLQKL